MMGRARTVTAIGLGIALLIGPLAAYADGPRGGGGAAGLPSPEVGSPEAVAAARVHFQKGRQLYQTGAYREAIVELDAARAIDPKAKDLVFNLGIVHEKLGQIDEALRYARLYAEMDLEPAERARAETYITRLEGAKSEIDSRTSANNASPKAPGDNSGETHAQERGRLDTATVIVGVVALAAAGAGAAFGVKALSDKPSSGFVTGSDGTYRDLQNQTSSAHREAVVSDVCFAGAVVAVGVAAGLYFGRSKDNVASPTATRARRLVVAPLAIRSDKGPPGAGLLLGGTF